jgi:hypothetical protein
MHAERLDPHPTGLELEPGALRVEAHADHDRVDDDRQRERQRDLLGQLGVFLGQREHDERADERQQHEPDQREVVHQLNLTASRTATTATAPPIIESA